MKLINQTLHIKTQPKSFKDITTLVNEKLEEQRIQNGLCYLFVKHTSCSLIISENYDPKVLQDLDSFMSQLVSEETDYRHNAEGKDDMPAHIRSVLTQTHLTIPVNNGKLDLGTWQAVYLWEHRAQSYERKIVLSCQSLG